MQSLASQEGGVLPRREEVVLESPAAIARLLMSWKMGARPRMPALTPARSMTRPLAKASSPMSPRNS